MMSWIRGPKSIKTKMSLLSLGFTVLPLIIVSFVSYYLAMFGMRDAGMGQIQDALEGGYTVIEEVYQRVIEGEISKKEGLNIIKRRLNGPIKEVWANLKNEKDLRAFLGLFRQTKNKEINFRAVDIWQENKRIAVYSEEKKSLSILQQYPSK